MVKLRIATIEDAEPLAAIYGYYVVNTAVSFEYTAPDDKEFAERITHKLAKYPYIVAEEDGHLLGYAYASQLRERASYDWDAEMSIYLDKDECGRGVGSRLYGAIIELLTLQNFSALYSGVTTPNAKSEALHEKFGFVRLGITNNIGYKNGAWHGVIWYEKRINYMNNEPPLPIIPFPELDKRTVQDILSRFE